jgi:uncharacterized delta-60 repeat protein
MRFAPWALVLACAGPVEVDVLDAAVADATGADVLAKDARDDAGDPDAADPDAADPDAADPDAADPDAADPDAADPDAADPDAADPDAADPDAADPDAADPDAADPDAADPDAADPDAAEPDAAPGDTGVNDAGVLGPFGANGFVLGPSPGFAGGNLDELRGVAVDGNQRVVGVGSTRAANGSRRALIVRYDPSGALDPTFATDGAMVGVNDGAIATFLGGAASDDELMDVVIDAAGRIVVSGRAGDGQGRHSTLLARYLSNGQIDSSFGSGGFVIGQGTMNLPFSGFTLFPDERFARVDIDSMGRIAAGGAAAELMQDFFYRTLAARFTSAGVLDTTFSQDGFVVGDAAGTNWFTGVWDELFSMDITTGDELLGSGWAADPTFTDERTLLVRYTTQGVLSPAFNAAATPGFILSAPGSAAGGTKQVSTCVATDAAGRIVTSGFSFDANNVVFVFVQRNAGSGPIDNAFGSGGTVVAQPSATGSAAEYPYGMAIDSMGRIVVVGSTDDAGTGGRDRAIVYRFTGAGALDGAFNPTGIPAAGAIETWTGGVSELAGGTDDAFNDVAIGAGDRIYAAGTSGGRSVIVRYQSDGCLDRLGPCAN